MFPTHLPSIDLLNTLSKIWWKIISRDSKCFFHYQYKKEYNKCRNNFWALWYYCFFYAKINFPLKWAVEIKSYWVIDHWKCDHWFEMNTIAIPRSYYVFFCHNWNGKSSSHIENDTVICIVCVSVSEWSNIYTIDGRNGVRLKLEYMFIWPQWTASSRKLTRQTSIK